LKVLIIVHLVDKIQLLMKYLALVIIICSLVSCNDNKITPATNAPATPQTTSTAKTGYAPNTTETTTEIVIDEDSSEDKIEKLSKVSNGSKVSNAKYSDSEGNQYMIENLKGKTLVIDYWATWCAPCLEDMPAFDQLRADFSDNKNLIFLKLSIDEDKKTWTNHIKQNKTNSYWIGRDKTNPLYWFTYKKIDYEGKELILESLPRYAIIGPDGVIINNNAPSPQTDKLSATINALKL